MLQLLTIVFAIYSQMAYASMSPTFEHVHQCVNAFAVFDAVRIWSICGHRLVPTFIVFVLGMFEPAVNIVSRFIAQISK